VIHATTTLADDLRRVVASSTLSQNQIAREAGISQASLNLFVNRHRDLKLATAARLAAYFGLVFCCDSSERPK
jgi:plasmid maintenance system antidote protein VapI